MTVQLNPSLQRKSSSTQRLVKISRELPSDTPQLHQGEPCYRVIPFLLESAQHDWITHDLCHVLNQRGHTSLLCYLDESAPDKDSQLIHQLYRHSRDTKYCLLPMTSPYTLSPCGMGHVVLLVPASLEGVTSAYRKIKLLSREETPEIGVVIVGSRDQHAAWRHFRKLAVGSLRFLDIPLLNLGFLPEQVAPDHGPADHHRKNFLARISERLLRSEFYDRYYAQTSADGEQE